MSIRLDTLRRSHTEVSDGIAAIESRAVAENRDLTDAEQADVDALYVRAAQLRPEIEAEGVRAESLAASAAVLARIQPSAQRPVMTRSQPAAQNDDVMSMGEYMSLVWRSTQQGDTDAAEILQRAVAEQVLSGNPGIVPLLIVGNLIKLVDDRRPVMASFTSRPMPQAGKSFIRPKVVTRVAVGRQMNELDELSSRSMVITGENVDKHTYGGVLELSEQDLDWTDPAILQICIDDFVGMYGNVTEKVACDFLVASATNGGSWTATSIATMISSITTGIGDVYGTAKRMPDTLWLDLASMLALAAQVNPTTDLSALSLLKQALGDAGVPLNFVTGPQLPPNTRILGSSGLVESYEQLKGLLSLQDVSHLGLNVAYRGYLTFYARAEGLVSLT